MAKVAVYTPNHSGTGEMLVGPEMRRMVSDAGDIAVSLYRARVQRATGENARAVRVHTEIGGRKNDRWTAVVTAYAPHAAAREFGNRGVPGEHVLRDIANEIEGGIDA